MRRLPSFAAILIVVACAPGPRVAPLSPPAMSSPATGASSGAASTSPQPSTTSTSGLVVTLEPAATPAPTMSSAERDLVAALRDDAVVNCTPRRADLPPRALAGVECRPESDLVARVGLYRFRSDEDAALAYLARMASYDVKLNNGRCHLGEPGDSGSGLEGGATVVFEGETFDVRRNGCFHDENGIANYRLTCWGGALYVGVLGRTTDLAALSEWVEMGNVDTPGPPGICVPGG